MKSLRYAYGKLWYAISGAFHFIASECRQLGLESAHYGAVLQDEFIRAKHAAKEGK